MTNITGPDGVIVLPRNIAIGAALSLVLPLAGWIWAAGGTVSKHESRFDAIDRRFVALDDRFVEERKRTDAAFTAVGDSDKRITDRSDERYTLVRARLELLERDRDRITRVEEQMKIATDLLREIRQAIGSRSRP